MRVDHEDELRVWPKKHLKHRDDLVKIKKSGLISQHDRNGSVANGDATTLLNWLVYAALGIIGSVFGFWNTLMTQMICKAQDKIDDVEEKVQTMKDSLIENMRVRDVALYDKMEDRRKETKKDLERIESEVKDGHRAILNELKELRKVNGRG